MKILIYANGIVHCSVCAPENLTREAVEHEVNLINPSGVGLWKISKEKFRSGADNPCPCDKDSKKLHYLMVC